MVSVVGMSAILFAIAAIVMTRNFSDYNQVRSDRRFEQAIQVADSGVDHSLYKVGANPSYNTGDPEPPDFAGDTGAEEAWVLQYVANNPLVTTPEGQWATIVPADTDVIYSVGYVPTKANPFKVRIIRAAYDYAPFVPSTAILTDGNLQISGNAHITGAGGSVHANGDVIYGGSPSVDGYVSAAGTCTGCNSPTIGDCQTNGCQNSGGGKPVREVPLVNPRENYDMSHYDLCPNGEVRTGPSYADGDGKAPNATGVPCGGTLIPYVGETWHGWKYMGFDSGDGHMWQFSDPAPFDGVYYVYQGSAKVTSSPGTPTTPWKVSIFAEATATGEEPGHCPHVGGDIDMAGGGDVKRNDRAQPLHLIAGRDLQMHGTPGNKWEGVYAAHEQFELTGNVEVNGVIIANDYCDTNPESPVRQNTINVGGSASLTYAGNLEIPLGRRIRTTHWNEI